VIFSHDVERLADRRERRDHRIDCKGIQRHQPGEHDGHLARAWPYYAVMGQGIEHGTRLLAD
jgi:hypothetical protein